MTGTHPVEREEVMAWLDGELSSEHAAAVSSHVAACADCGALADDLRQVSTRVAAWTVEPPPAEWRAGAQGATGPRIDATSRRWPQRRVLIAVAVAASAVMAILVPLERRPGLRSEHMAISVEGQAPAAAPGAVEESRQRSSGYTSPRPVENTAPAVPQQGQQGQQPMIARTVSLSLTTERFEDVRSALERATAAEGGSIVSLATGGEARRRTLRATVRVPAARLDAALAAFRALGVVKHESLATDDVTDSYRDLTVRIRNARVEEQRLVELLRTRTGTVKDVLDVEREIARVRSEAERMAAEAEATVNRVTFSMITLEIAETYRAEFASAGELPVGLRLRNALVEGVRSARQSVLEVALEIARTGPTLVAWALLAGPMAWIVWRRLRRASAVAAVKPSTIAPRS